MQFDIESVFEDNVRLKKALQMSKFSNDKLEKEFKQVKIFYDEEIERNTLLKADYCELQRKYQQSYTESLRDNNSLISQIQELKKIIDQKQRDLQQIQIKLIPSLDQDMLRVKLITEMQGPYQQTVQKKDKQIERQKQKIADLQRSLQLASLGLKFKIDQLKKQNYSIKSRYEQQTNRLMQELNLALSRYETQSVEVSIIKNQKKQIQELKITLDFINSNQEKNIQEIQSLKEERSQLLQNLMLYNSKETLLADAKYSVDETQKLKDQNMKQLKLIENFKIENQKLRRQLPKLEQEINKLINQHEKQLNNERSKFNNEKNQLSNEIYSLKDQIKFLNNQKIQSECGRQINYEKNTFFETEINLKNKQIDELKLEVSRLNHKFFEQTRTLQQGTNSKEQNTTQNLLHEKKKLQNLQKQNQKLRKKLNEANEKILSLIRDKMKYVSSISPQRQRIHSQIDKPIGVFLPYQDCSFKPLVQPTLYTYKNCQR